MKLYVRKSAFDRLQEECDGWQARYYDERKRNNIPSKCAICPNWTKHGLSGGLCCIEPIQTRAHQACVHFPSTPRMVTDEGNQSNETS